ncbi:MAG: hypothetical protein PHS68_05750, partial [Candidatus Izemoplasmatales bacterium]|nr:hypothetical protein [Candidatus Izemoplasmatales bacterium]
TYSDFTSDLADKYYYVSRLRTLDDNATQIRVYDGYTLGTISSPVQNTWYFNSYVRNTISVARIYIDVVYINTTESLGATTEIDYAYVFNISTLVTNQQYSPLFNTTFDLMTEANIKSQMDTWIADGLDTIIYGTDSEFYRIRDEWEELKELKEEPFPTMNVPDLDLAYFDETFFDYAYYYHRLIFLEPETQDYLLELYYDSQLGNLRREFFVTDLLCYYMGYGLDEWPYSVDYYNEMAERFSTDYTSLDFATFSDWGEEGSLTFTYDVYPPAPDIDVSIEDFIDNLGLGDFARPLIIAAFIMIIIVFTLIFSGGSAPWFVYIIELVSGILLATIFGWIPVWITLIIGAVLMFAIFFKLKSGGNGGDEG